MRKQQNSNIELFFFFILFLATQVFAQEISPESCIEFSGGSCIKCLTNFHIYDGVCYKDILGCIKYEDGSTCASCEDTSFNLIQGNCQLKPGITMNEELQNKLSRYTDISDPGQKYGQSGFILTNFDIVKRWTSFLALNTFIRRGNYAHFISKAENPIYSIHYYLNNKTYSYKILYYGSGGGLYLCIADVPPSFKINLRTLTPITTTNLTDNCIDYTLGSRCSRCSIGYHLESNRCYKNYGGCTKYKENICIECLDYYVLTQNRCISDCVSTSDTRNILFYQNGFNKSTLQLSYGVSISQFYAFSVISIRDTTSKAITSFTNVNNSNNASSNNFDSNIRFLGTIVFNNVSTSSSSIETSQNTSGNNANLIISDSVPTLETVLVRDSNSGVSSTNTRNMTGSSSGIRTITTTSRGITTEGQTSTSTTSSNSPINRVTTTSNIGTNSNVGTSRSIISAGSASSSGGSGSNRIITSSNVSSNSGNSNAEAGGMTRITSAQSGSINGNMNRVTTSSSNLSGSQTQTSSVSANSGGFAKSSNVILKSNVISLPSSSTATTTSSTFNTNKVILRPGQSVPNSNNSTLVITNPQINGQQINTINSFSTIVNSFNLSSSNQGRNQNGEIRIITLPSTTIKTETIKQIAISDLDPQMLAKLQGSGSSTITTVQTQTAGVKDQNCISYNSSGVCIKCSKGFFINRITTLCQMNFCQTANQQTGDCETCYPGFQLQNGVCAIPNQ